MYKFNFNPPYNKYQYYNSYSSNLKPKISIKYPLVNSLNNNTFPMNDMLKKPTYIHKGNMFDTLKRTTGCGCGS